MLASDGAALKQLWGKLLRNVVNEFTKKNYPKKNTAPRVSFFFFFFFFFFFLKKKKKKKRERIYLQPDRG